MTKEKSKNRHKTKTIKEELTKFKNKYFSKEEIKEIFSYYREPGRMIISDDQFDNFCDCFSFLRKSIVKRIEKEIYFIILQKDGFYINFQCKDLINKKGIIYICPHILEDNMRNRRCNTIYHEIAHHIKGHKDGTSPEDFKKAEDEADKLVEKWLKDYYSKDC